MVHDLEPVKERGIVQFMLDEMARVPPSAAGGIRDTILFKKGQEIWQKKASIFAEGRRSLVGISGWSESFHRGRTRRHAQCGISGTTPFQHIQEAEK